MVSGPDLRTDRSHFAHCGSALGSQILRQSCAFFVNTQRERIVNYLLKCGSLSGVKLYHKSQGKKKKNKNNQLNDSSYLKKLVGLVILISSYNYLAS